MKTSPLNKTVVYGPDAASILFMPETMKMIVHCGTQSGHSDIARKRFKELEGHYTGMTLAVWIRDEVAVWVERGFNVFMVICGNAIQIG